VDIKTVQLESLHIIGLVTSLTPHQRKNKTIITAHWKGFNRALYNIPGYKSSATSWVKYGITYFNQGQYHYLSGIPLRNDMIIPQDMQELHIKPGDFLFAEHMGPMYTLYQTINRIFQDFIPSSGYLIRQKGCDGLIMIEKYDSRFQWNRADSVISLYVPLENIQQ